MYDREEALRVIRFYADIDNWAQTSNNMDSLEIIDDREIIQYEDALGNPSEAGFGGALARRFLKRIGEEV